MRPHKGQEIKIQNKYCTRIHFRFSRKVANATATFIMSVCLSVSVSIFSPLYLPAWSNYTRAARSFINFYVGQFYQNSSWNFRLD